jgi:hypothetical protein
VLKKLFTDVTINLKVGENLEQFLSASGTKQGPILFIFVIHGVSNSLDKKWKFESPDFRFTRILKLETREDSYVEPSTSTREQSSRASSPTMWMARPSSFSAAGELIPASKLIVSHFRRFGLTTIHTEVKSKKEDSKTEAMQLPRPGQKSSLTDTEDIEIDDDEDRFMPFCIKFKYLRTFFMPELNDTADITERISQARKLFNSMNQQVLSNKRIPIDIRRRLYQAIVVNIGLWGSERSWVLKEEDRSKLEMFRHNCLRRMCNWTMWDIKEKRITNERLEELLQTHPQWNQ